MLGALRLCVAPRRFAVALSGEGLTARYASTARIRVGTPGVDKISALGLRSGPNTGRGKVIKSRRDGQDLQSDRATPATSREEKSATLCAGSGGRSHQGTPRPRLSD